MYKSKTIETVQKYYDLGSIDREPTSDEKDFVYYFELELAKSILSEFSNDSVCKLVKILLAFTDKNLANGYTSTLYNLGR